MQAFLFHLIIPLDQSLILNDMLDPMMLRIELDDHEALMPHSGCSEIHCFCHFESLTRLIHIIHFYSPEYLLQEHVLAH